MSWDDKAVAPVVETKPEPVVEAKPEPHAAEAKAEAADVKPAETAETKAPEADAAPAVKDEPAKDDGYVPQNVVGKVAKKIREKSRAEIEKVSARVKELEAENQRLKDQQNGSGTYENPVDAEEKARIAQAVEEQFLIRQDAYGREKYGDGYEDAVLLIKSQNDPVLLQKIMRAANPADTLMKEAERIAKDQEYGSDPAERERKMRAEIEAETRKKVEAEFAEKLAARGKQITDVQNVRAAGGDVRPAPRSEDWTDALKS